MDGRKWRNPANDPVVRRPPGRHHDPGDLSDIRTLRRDSPHRGRHRRTGRDHVHLGRLRLLEYGDDERIDEIAFHREFRGSPTTDESGLVADDFVRKLSDFVRSARLTSTRHDPVAVRDDDLCLSRSEYWFGDDKIVRYAVFECRDDLIHRAWFYDAARLDDALEMLGRRWVERGGPAHVVEIERVVLRGRRSW